jgi:hypothetical protein
MQLDPIIRFSTYGLRDILPSGRVSEGLDDKGSLKRAP